MKQYIAEYIVPVEKKGNDCMFDFMNAKPLIRCKDCKFNPKKIVLGCPMAGSMSRNDDSFCSVGKRRKTKDEGGLCAFPKEDS